MAAQSVISLPERVDGDGVLVRRWRPDDAEALDCAVAESADHLRPWMAWISAEPLTIEQRRAWLAEQEREWASGGDLVCGVFVGDAVAGGCGLHRRRGPGVLEIGYWTHVAFTRRGIATAAARTLTDAAFTVPDIEAVEIHHDRANVASAGVPRGLGFRFVGETRDEPEAPADEGIDCTWRMERSGWGG